MTDNHGGGVAISGASSGIGEACAIRLADRGWHVYAGVRREEDGARLSRLGGGQIHPLILDITDPESVARAVREIEAACPNGLRGLVNNAGTAVIAPLEFVPLDDFRRQLEVNVVGQVGLTQGLLPQIRRGRGRVVMMGSLGGRLAQPLAGPYCASKFAMEALADCLRMELARWNIQVALVEPGAVSTAIWEKGRSHTSTLLSKMSPAAATLYGVALQAVMEATRRADEQGSDAARVADAVEHALSSAHPHTRYLVGRDARLGAIAARLLPDRARDWILLRAFGLSGKRANQAAGG